MKNFDWDKIWIGLLLGIIAPFIALLTYYFINYSYMTTGEFINYLIRGDMYTALISLCVLANLAAFYPFIWKEKWSGARGVLGATFLWAIVVVILKVV